MFKPWPIYICNMRIAFFDSGLGGLSVLHEALSQLPKEDYVYFADTHNVPYGSKTRNEVKQFVFQAVEELIKHDIKALVVACNTATSIAIKDLRQRYPFPIIGMEPAVKPAIEKYEASRKRVLVLATTLTLQEDKYSELISKIDRLQLADAMPMPGLVNLCERLQFDDALVLPYLEEQLKTIDFDDYGAVVLGCTHFPFFRDALSRYLPAHVEISDGNQGTVKHLKNTLAQLGLLSDSGKSNIKFLSSSKSTEEPLRMAKALQFLNQTK